MSSDVVDLYALRCAIATVVHARDHLDELDRPRLIQLDSAVSHLASIAASLHGEMASATRALLSDQPDPGGRRTISSIGHLAHLTHVDAFSAPALASRLPSATRPKQQRLFDPSLVESAGA